MRISPQDFVLVRDLLNILLIRALVLSLKAYLFSLVIIRVHVIGSNLESDASTLAQLWIYLHASIGLLTDASANVQTLAQALRWLKLTRDLECFAKRLHKSQLIFIAYPDPRVTYCDLDEDLVISRFCFDFNGEDSELLTCRILDCIVD